MTRHLHHNGVDGSREFVIPDFEEVSQRTSEALLRFVHTPLRFARIAQWQSSPFVRCRRGFDSYFPLQDRPGINREAVRNSRGARAPMRLYDRLSAEAVRNVAASGSLAPIQFDGGHPVERTRSLRIGERVHPIPASLPILQDCRSERELSSLSVRLHREDHSSRKGDLCFWPKTKSSTGVHGK